MKYLGIFMLVAVFLAACGESDSTTTVINEAPAKSTDEGGSGAGADSNKPASSEPASVTLPDYTGERLDIAEDDIEDLGLKWEEIGGGTFGVVDVTAWEVCETDPGAGAKLAEGDEVELVVDRPGSC